jgi:DNA-binding GntR family transcriptional regulator
LSALSPISISSLANQALAKLVQAITSGEFRPGQKLSEANLAREFGISRGPLREALGRLEGRLVMRTPRIGVRVIQLSHADLEELFTIREALEGMACRLAAQRITDPEVSDLNGLLDNHRRDTHVLSRQGYYQRSRDDDFHMKILRCAENQRLEELLMDGLYYQLQLYRFRASSEPGRAQVAFDEHCAIVLALKDRDPDAAEALMRQHIRNSFASLAKAHATREQEQAKLKGDDVESRLKTVRGRA